MTYNIGEKKDGKLIVEFKLNADEWESEVQKAYERNKGKYKLDGFRQGKIPRKVLEKNYGEFLFYEDALSVACDNCFFEMLEKEKDIQAVDYPDISVKNVSKDGVEFVATITLLPEVTLGAYTGIEVKTPDIVIKVNPERMDLVKTRIVDGRECLVIDLGTDVVVNGIAVHQKIQED